MATTNEHETQVRRLVEEWAGAVRRRDLEGILAHHAHDFVMFDVPKPFQSVGLDAYRKTWELFFAFSKPGVFDIRELHVVSDANVAFCFAVMQCGDRSSTPDFVDLDFRLTVGLEKVDGRWTVVHEHHSIPSE